MKNIFSLFFCISLFFTILACSPLKCVEQETFEDVNEKIYINAKDLLICEDGLFLYHSETYIPLESISYDDSGLYVKLLKGREEIKPLKAQTCLNGHPIYHSKSIRDCNGCDGCANWLCPFRCKCYSPWH